MTTGSVITFYSYKGGVGRTQSVANVAVLLSRWGYRVLCIDWDLEAPGLSLYFKDYIREEKRAGLVELVEAHRDGHNPRWENFSTLVEIPSETDPERKTEISCIFAGNQDSSYIARVQKLDWKKLYENQDTGFFFENLRNTWKSCFDFVLIDSRTGVTDVGGICTVQMPDLVVAFLTANNQSFLGTSKIISSANAARKGFQLDRENILFLPILSRFESRVEYQTAQNWLHEFSKLFGEMFRKWVHSKVKVSEVIELTKIPYIPYWSFGEKICVLEEQDAAPDSLSYAFETLSALLANKLSKSSLLTHDRDAFVSTAKRKLIPGFDYQRRASQNRGSSGVRVYVSFVREDVDFFQLLLPHLEGLKKQGFIDDFSIDAQEEGYLEQFEIILILLSPSYMASEYVHSELNHAFNRSDINSKFVLPVLVRPVDLTGTIVEKRQFVPRDGKAVSLWNSFDEAFLDVVRAIRIKTESFSEDKIRPSPFIYGPAVPPEQFYGRREQIAHIRQRIGGRAPQCVNIVGLHRNGKSSMLRYVKERTDEFFAPEQKPIVVLLDLQDRRFHQPIGIIEGLRRTIEKQTGKVPWAKADNEDLFEVEDGLEALREQGYRLIVMFDEFEAIGERLGVFHDWGDHWRSQASAGRLSLVIASRRPVSDIYQRLELTSPFGNIFSTIVLGTLDAESWRKLLSNANLSLEEMQWVYRLAGHHPYYTQLAASAIWQYGDFDLASQSLLPQLQQRFSSLWQTLSSSERLTLKQITNSEISQLQMATVEMLKLYGLLRADSQIFSEPFSAFVGQQS
ncbi:MAG: TIR domain-containing protein [Cyanobacteria bacterium P01_D01_bin.1]